MVSPNRMTMIDTWLGLVPRQVSTGGNARPIGISKRGNRCLRKLFIQGQPSLGSVGDSYDKVVQIRLFR